MLSHAMERAFDTLADQTTDPEAGLVIALFQRGEYFDVEAERYAELAATGHTVIVGFAESARTLPPVYTPRPGRRPTRDPMTGS